MWRNKGRETEAEGMSARVPAIAFVSEDNECTEDSYVHY